MLKGLPSLIIPASLLRAVSVALELELRTHHRISKTVTSPRLSASASASESGVLAVAEELKLILSWMIFLRKQRAQKILLSRIMFL